MNTLAASLCKNVKNTSMVKQAMLCMPAAESNRSFSHQSSGLCGCMLCLATSSLNRPTQTFSSNMMMDSSFHTSKNMNMSSLMTGPSSLSSPLLVKQPYTFDQSASMIQKRPFTLSHSDDDDSHHIDGLLDNNKAWVEKMRTKFPEEYKKLAMNQSPKYLYFGCSDSRVPANQIMGLGPGEVFVHRNVGNLVPGNDLNALSVLEFAVGHVGVTDIIVNGHYNCGAIKAAVTRQDLGMLENWLRLIRDVYRLHRDYLDRIPNDDDRHKKLVELNVIEQCINIYKTGIVQRKRLQNKMNDDPKLKKAPRIHALVFDTDSGYLQRLDVDYTRVGSLDSIYCLGYNP